MRKKELIEKYIAAEKTIAMLQINVNTKVMEMDKLNHKIEELEKECAKHKKQAQEAKNNVDKVLEDYKQYQANKLKLDAVMGDDEEGDEGIAIGDFVGSLG